MGKSTTTLRKHKDEHGLYKRVVLIFLYTENHSLYEWFKKAYGDE